MKILNNKSNNINNDLPEDPLQLDGSDALNADFSEKDAPENSDNPNQIVRIGKLEKKIVRSQEEDIDPDTVVSMYMPRRRMHRIGAMLLRLDKLSLLLLGALALIVVIFIAAFSQENMGNFTINLNRLELYRKGIAIASDRNFTDPTARLNASALDDATNISIDNLPTGLNEVDGDHNGEDYVAYTYYIRNGGKESVNYIAQIVLENASKGAEEAARVAVWRNDERIVYAEPAATGLAEPGTQRFESHNIVCTYEVSDFLVGYVDKYTVVIWLEGDDPECVDAIVGGSLQFSMNIDSDSETEDSLFQKFVSDVRDAITGNNPINAAGVNAPDNYHINGPITWDNRRNK